MSRFLDFLLDEEVIAANPFASVSKRRKPKPPPPMKHHFTPEQLAALWNTEGHLDCHRCRDRSILGVRPEPRPSNLL